MVTPISLNSLMPLQAIPDGGVLLISLPSPTDPTQRIFGTLSPSALNGVVVGGGSPAGAESPDRTTITGQNGIIYDANLNRFTLVLASDGATLGVAYNGNYQVGTHDVVLGLYYNHSFYQEVSSGYFYRWNGSGYDAGVNQDPRTTDAGTGMGSAPGAESPSGTTINSRLGTIYDANKNRFTLVPASDGTTLGIALNDNYQTNTHNAVLGLYYNHAFYQQVDSGYYYRWNGTSYDNGSLDDPRAVGSGTVGGGGGTTTPGGGTSTGTGGLHTYPEGTSGPYGGIGDTGSGAGPQAYLYGRSLGDLFGTYTYPNPGGTDQGYTLKHCLDKLYGITGVRPKTFNAFIDRGYESIQRVGDGSFAYGWNNDDPTISGPNGYVRPIIGLKMHGNNDPKNNYDTFVDVKNGVYDNLYLNEMNTWIGLGYKHLVYRLAFEFNGTFMPDYFGGDAATNTEFAAAMRHLILLMKNRAAQAGIKAEFTFNPTYINGIDTDVMNGWPGDDVVDIIDTDQYSSCYPRFDNNQCLNYDANGVPTGTSESSLYNWLQNPNNRKKFWNYPGIKTNYPPKDVYDYSSGGWSMLRAIEIAKAKNKPIAFSECGTGGGSNTDAFYNNDPTWVRWFWQTLQSAISQGVSIAHVNIWNIYADDGRWMYSAPDSFDPQPDVALAYRKYFGDGAFAGGPTPVSGDGTVPTVGGGTGGTGGGSSTPSGVTYVSQGASLPTSGSNTPSANGSTLGGTSGSLVDAAGIRWTLTSVSGRGNLPTLGNVVDDRPGIAGLAQLLYYNDTMFANTTDGGWFSFAFGEYSHVDGDPRGTGTGGSLATVAVTDTSGHTATITLPATPADGEPSINGSDTGLSVDLYYYADSSNGGQLTVGSSNDGAVSSMAITQNGHNVVSSLGLSGVTTINGASSGGGSSSGIATAQFVDGSGNNATITLDQGYRDYYTNETGLTMNVYYYFEGSVNAPLLATSADGNVASLLITRNGTNVTASDGLAGVTTYA